MLLEENPASVYSYLVLKKYYFVPKSVLVPKVEYIHR